LTMLWLAFARAIHIGASILLAAIFGFRLIVWMPAAAKHRRVERLQPRFRGIWGRLALISIAATVVSGLAWFWLVAASISGAANLLEVGPDTLQAVLLETQFGHVWLLRAGCCLVLCLLLLIGYRESLIAFFAFAMLASLAGAGHAGAIASSAGRLAAAGDVGHLISAALWPGGLVPLLFLLLREHRDADQNSGRFIADVVRRFSATSLMVVGLLAATGILNGYFIVGSLDALLTTSYGRLLLLKIALFLLMMGLGAWNLLVLKPRLSRAATEDSQAETAKPIRSLIRSVSCEILLASAVVLVIGFLGTTSPPPR
jgi:copper resistance protein D